MSIVETVWCLHLSYTPGHLVESVNNEVRR